MKQLTAIFGIILIFVISTYGQSQWVVYNNSNSNMPDNRVYNVTFDVMGNKWIGTYYGLARLTGSTWTSYYTSNSGLPDNTIYALAIDGNGHKWIGTNGGGLACFTGTATESGDWTVFNTSNSGLPDNYVRYSIVIDNNGNKWIATKAGLSKFDGQNWTTFNCSNSPLPHYEIRSMAVDVNNNLWIATQDGMARFDGSQAWNVFKPSNPISSTGLPHNNIMAIAIAPNGNKWIGTSGGLVKYDDVTMTTYKTTNSNIPSNSVVTVAVESNSVIWIGTDQQGIAKFDGINWITFNSSNSPLPYNGINSISIDASGNKWIGTYGGLAVYREGGIVSVEEELSSIPVDFELYKNYPNPFNPGTTITYNIPKTEFVSLKVYDMLGKEVTTLVNEKKPAGNYKVDFNALGFTSGMYLYTLQAGDYRETKKMLLLR